MAEQMFSGLLTRFVLDVQTIKDVIAIHDRARTLYYGSALLHECPDSDVLSVNDVWSGVRTPSLTSPKWLIYDHCAALTRLYALYEAFIEDLASEYLEQLPELYVGYRDLPASLLKQHRAGCGQVLLKMGESGPFRQIPEREMDSRLLGRTGGGDPYSLLKEAFFVDRQNYRAEPLARLFGYLGVGDVSSRIAKHQLMIQFLLDRRPETSYEAELNGFVRLRNEAAHRDVDEAVGTDEINFFADFLITLSQVLAVIISFEIVQRRLALGQMVELGTVQRIHYKGKVLIARMRNVAISVGDQLAVGDGKLRELVTLESIQDNGRSCKTVLPSEGEILGLGLSWRIKGGVGLVLYKFPPSTETPELFAAEEMVSVPQADSDSEPFQSETPESEHGDPDGGGFTQ